MRDRSDERAALPGRIPAWQNGACRYGAGRVTSSPTTPSISSPPHKVMASPKSARRPRASARREPPRLCAASRGRSEPLRFIISRRDMSAWADASLNLRCRSPVRVLHHNRRPERKAASSKAGGDRVPDHGWESTGPTGGGTSRCSSSGGARACAAANLMRPGLPSTSAPSATPPAPPASRFLPASIFRAVPSSRTRVTGASG